MMVLFVFAASISFGVGAFGDNSSVYFQIQRPGTGLGPGHSDCTVYLDGSRTDFSALDFSRGKAVGTGSILENHRRYYWKHGEKTMELTYREYVVLNALSDDVRIEGDVASIERTLSLQGHLKKTVSDLNMRAFNVLGGVELVRFKHGVLSLAPWLVEFPVRYLVDPEISVNRELRMVKFRDRYVELPESSIRILETILGATQPISPEEVLETVGIRGSNPRRSMAIYLFRIRDEFLKAGVELDRIHQTVDRKLIWIPRNEQSTGVSVEQRLSFSHSVEWKGHVVDLTTQQYRVFQVIRASGRAGLSFKHIAELAKIDVPEKDMEHAVRVHVANIRDKLLLVDSDFYQIVRVPNFGYSWVDFSDGANKSVHVSMLPQENTITYKGRSVTFTSAEYSVFNILLYAESPLSSDVIVQRSGLETKSEDSNVLLKSYYLRKIRERLTRGGLGDLGEFRYTVDDRVMWVFKVQSESPEHRRLPHFDGVRWKGRDVDLDNFDRRVFDVIRSFGVSGVDTETICRLIRRSSFGEISATSIGYSVARIRDRFRAVDPDFYGLVNLRDYGYAWVGDLLKNNARLPHPSSAKKFLSIPNIELYPDIFSALWNGVMVRFSPQAFYVLDGLLTVAPKVASYDDIFEHAWVRRPREGHRAKDPDEGVVLAEDNIRVHIRYIRKGFSEALLERDSTDEGVSFDRIHTISGVGYFWEDAIVPEVRIGALGFLPDKFRLTWNGKEVALNVFEQRIVSMLVNKTDHSATANQFYIDVNERDHPMSQARSVSVMISNLNGKFRRQTGSDEPLIVPSSTGRWSTLLYSLNPKLLSGVGFGHAEQ